MIAVQVSCQQGPAFLSPKFVLIISTNDSAPIVSCAPSWLFTVPSALLWWKRIACSTSTYKIASYPAATVGIRSTSLAFLGLLAATLLRTFFGNRFVEIPNFPAVLFFWAFWIILRSVGAIHIVSTSLSIASLCVIFPTWVWRWRASLRNAWNRINFSFKPPPPCDIQFVSKGLPAEGKRSRTFVVPPSS